MDKIIEFKSTRDGDEIVIEGVEFKRLYFSLLDYDIIFNDKRLKGILNSESNVIYNDGQFAIHYKDAYHADHFDGGHTEGITFIIYRIFQNTKPKTIDTKASVSKNTGGGFGFAKSRRYTDITKTQFDKMVKKYNVKPGDMVLFSPGLFSAFDNFVIKSLTASKFTHVGTVIEIDGKLLLDESTTQPSFDKHIDHLKKKAIGSGVMASDLYERLKSTSDRVYIRSIQTQGHNEKLVEHYKKWVGTPFEKRTWGQMGNSVFHFSRKEDSTSRFCSEHSADKYMYVGVLSDHDPPHYYTPSNLSKIPGFGPPVQIVFGVTSVRTFGKRSLLRTNLKSTNPKPANEISVTKKMCDYCNHCFRRYKCKFDTPDWWDTVAVPLFVSWYKGDTLVGCIGTFNPTSLTRDLCDLSIATAYEDGRSGLNITPLSKDMRVEINVIFGIEITKKYDWVKENGLIIETHDEKRATYLPSVIEEYWPDKKKILGMLLKKSGGNKIKSVKKYTTSSLYCKY